MYAPLNGPVTVQQVVNEDLASLLRELPSKVDLGAKCASSLPVAMNEVELEGLVARRRETADVYLLRWEGDRTPRGTNVGGRVIGWTSNGFVTDLQAEPIGTYERLLDQVGDRKRTNAMLVFVDRPAQT